MDVWQRGTAPSLIAGTSGSQYTADGWMVNWTASSSAAPTISQGSGRLLTKNSLEVTGAGAITDVQVQQRIESLIAAAFCSQTVTVQAQVYNNTGAAITPTLTVKRPSTQDGWSGTLNTDVNAVSLQSCANGAWTLVAYAFAANANSYNGLEIIFDFGNDFSSAAKSIQITECDIRVTPSATAGQSNAAPPPELRPIWTELACCQRYLYVLNQSAALNIVLFGESFSTSAAFFAYTLPVPQRASPAVTLSSASDWTVVYGAASAVGVASLGATVFGANDNVGQINITVSSAVLTVGQAVGLAKADSSARIFFSSEL
jgi:hypothetical protein